jgi:murein DD-endopeptidase MepM/ murein hydrolase activator NlpD
MPFFVDSAPPEKSLPIACRKTLRHRRPRRLVACTLALVGLAAIAVADADPASARSAREATPGADLPHWSWPVPDPHPVVREFESPSEDWSPGHRGIDIGVADGATVTAPDSGVVHFAGTVVDRPVLSIEHADGILSSVEPVLASVVAGDEVKRGQVVGTVDGLHKGCGRCLHLGARVDGKYVNPLLLLGELRPAVLLPTRR